MRNHFQRIIRRRTLRRKPQVKTLKGSNYETNELRCRFNHIFIYTIFYNRNGRQKEIKIKRKELMKDTKMSAEKVVKDPKPKLMNIKFEKLHPFRNHPYKVIDDESMAELLESIKQYGMLSRIIVCPLEDKPEEYEIISGHRRVLAAELLEMKGVPAVIHFIDPVAAEVVKSVFKMCLEGKGNETIARILQEKQILVPMAYWQSKGLPRGGKKTQSNPYKWCKTTIQKILSQQEYCGDVINFKTCSKSFKNKTRLPNNPENWAIFKDVHEPIIARDDFEKVQTLIAKTKRRAPKPKNGEKSIFCDLLFCGDCHGKLRHHTNTINKDIHYFVCANNKVDYRGECPGRHYVRADATEQVVMLELRRMAEFLAADEEAFAELLAQKTDKELLKKKKNDEAELQKAIARNDTVSHLYEKLYEDNAVGKVSDEWFMQLSHKYETERLELKTKIKTLRQKLSECGQREQERENFTSAIRRFMRMDRLTAPLLRELIDHIDVFETEGKGKNRTQRIVIYYRFVGYVEIPEVSQRPNIVADTRKGVATKYLTEPKTA